MTRQEREELVGAYNRFISQEEHSIDFFGSKVKVRDVSAKDYDALEPFLHAYVEHTIKIGEVEFSDDRYLSFDVFTYADGSKGIETYNNEEDLSELRQAIKHVLMFDGPGGRAIPRKRFISRRAEDDIQNA